MVRRLQDEYQKLTTSPRVSQAACIPMSLATRRAWEALATPNLISNHTHPFLPAMARTRQPAWRLDCWAGCNPTSARRDKIPGLHAAFSISPSLTYSHGLTLEKQASKSK